jgi:hypothetical protein
MKRATSRQEQDADVLLAGWTRHEAALSLVRQINITRTLAETGWLLTKTEQRALNAAVERYDRLSGHRYVRGWNHVAPRSRKRRQTDDASHVKG